MLEAMKNSDSDKPDTRFGMEMVDTSDIVVEIVILRYLAMP